MWYAIVDIETTGGHAAANGITEISIQLHDGIQKIGTFETLVNPGQPIPRYITGLTGISNEMVSAAPGFADIAEKVYSLLRDCVFVAHNVNFDYSFLSNELAKCGYQLHASKLCTVRLSRKFFPGLPSYSLGNICGYLGITIDSRHRAGGDAAATVKLFERLLAADQTGLMKKALKRNSKEQSLPPNLPYEQFDKLPDLPGIYYFHDQSGKVVYVGKAKRIRKRVSSHFSNNSASRQKQDFMRAIYSVSHEVCGNELIALLLESHEIKRLWPKFNRAQKHFEQRFAIVHYNDQKGLLRFGMEKLRKGGAAPACFSSPAECHSQLALLAGIHGLCPRLSGIASAPSACEDPLCACRHNNQTVIKAYNRKMTAAIAALSTTESYVIIEEGRSSKESAYVVVENGHFTGMGYIATEELQSKKLKLDDFRGMSLYRENFNIRAMIERYKEEHPDRVVCFS